MGIKHLIPAPLNIFRKKDRKLGIARRKREYDIPLHKKMGSEFLTLLIGLMTFLAILALTGSLILSHISDQWSSGLQSKMTVEIPAETQDGRILELDEVIEISQTIASRLSSVQGINKAQALSKTEIKALLSPWLGENIDYTNIPLPGLVALEVSENKTVRMESIKSAVMSIAPWAQVNTHNKWLRDITRLSDSLRMIALFITIVIALTTFAAVAAAIRARIATHYEELELLHLMGASDEYICRQFQKHAFLLAIKGASGGLIAAYILTKIISWMTHDIEGALLPDLSLDLYDYLTLITVPFLIGLIAVLTARRITLRELGAMA